MKATGEYYTDEASKLLQAGTISQYMERVIQRIDSENVRSRKFLYPSSYTKVTFECEQRMVGDHLPFLHSECKGMVEREEKTDLGNMYRLLKPISGAQQVLLDEVQAHIKQQGLQAISGLKGENVSNHYHTVWKLMFSNFTGEILSKIPHCEASISDVTVWSFLTASFYVKSIFGSSKNVIFAMLEALDL